MWSCVGQPKYQKTFYQRIPFFFVSDIPDIPDLVRNLQALQVADFSSNPIQRCVKNQSLFFFICSILLAVIIIGDI